MTDRATALAKAVAWAESAEGCYRRANRARDDAHRHLGDGPAWFAATPKAHSLITAADTEYRHAQIETGLAAAWAAIALAAKE